ncbi:MAG TPA: hypothetical protein VE777_07655 [Gaiellales bacterium]|jgi:hypothetical protein|nr:hypothetical protein [Gaiellales bacterium]
MDMSRITRSMWIVIGGTAAAVIGALFLDWYSITAHVGPLSISASASAWSVNALGKLAVLGSVVMLAGVVLLFVPGVELPVPLPMALLVASAFTLVMVILEFLDHHSNTAIGLWVTLVGSAVATYGAYEMGGRITVPSRAP